MFTWPYLSIVWKLCLLAVFFWKEFCFRIQSKVAAMRRWSVVVCSMLAPATAVDLLGLSDGDSDFWLADTWILVSRQCQSFTDHQQRWRGINYTRVSFKCSKIKIASTSLVCESIPVTAATCSSHVRCDGFLSDANEGKRRSALIAWREILWLNVYA